VRSELVSLVGGYLASDALGTGIDAFVVPPALGARAGVLGAIALAELAAQGVRAG
jgi:fructokinase